MAFFIRAHLVMFLVAAIFLFVTVVTGTAAGFPKPFNRQLDLQDPLLEGNDVAVLQNLLLRSKYVTSLKTNGYFDRATKEAVKSYQSGNNLTSSGVFDRDTAYLVLEQLMYDHYKDDGSIAQGYKFKVHIPVHKNRDIETIGTLYDADHRPRYTFLARCHGSIDSVTGEARNQLTINGNTPTGLTTFDLNSPEPNPKSFGPYPVIRSVKGLGGNAAIGRNVNNTFISDFRSGILLHTGEWDKWNPSMRMPNSNGCIHVHPDAQKTIIQILVEELGVVVRDNPFGTHPYPYVPQGLLSIEQIETAEQRDSGFL